jgi:fluoride exporter
MGLTLLVSVAAALGAVARYVLDIAVQRRYGSGLPRGTFVINVSGSFALGLVTGLAMHHGLNGHAATVLGTGMLGGYTTWSTFTWETFALAEQGRMSAAAANAAGSLAIGLAAAAAGLGVALL